MKPKNIKERRSGFLKFILLFVVVVGTMMTAIFFNFRIPKKENELLRERSRNMEREMTFQKEFSTEMLSSKALLDSLDIPGQNMLYINSLLSKKLVDLQQSIPRKDSTYRYDMYTSIVETLVNLQKIKNELKSLGNAKGRIKEYRTELEKTRQELKETKRDLDILRMSSRR